MFFLLGAGCLGQFLCFLLQQLVKGLLYSASHQFLKLPLDYFLVSLYHLFRHSF